MKTAPRILLISFAVVSCATAAALPQKAPITKYTGLWTNSPFTSKPLPPPPPDTVNPLEDLALLGVSPISSGYRVTMVNKKKPEERVVVDSDSLKSDYKILEVTRKPGDPLGTVVRMQAGSITGTVSFDEKLLVIAAPKAPPKPAPGTPGTAVPPQMGGLPGQTVPPGGTSATRLPRPRVVPPSPTPAPAPVASPATNQSSQSGSRSSRRGSYGR